VIDERKTKPRLEPDPLWYKDAIVYQLHVKAFFDSDDDGIGDFRGLTEKLDYLQDLGVNTLWLLPFYPSPMRDDGYDIADYRNIYPDYGTRKDFRHFVREAHHRGLRIITELVINHTSDQHPWFQAARRAPPDSAKRAFYVWSDSDQKFPETRVIFTDTEPSNWAWDPVAKAYYWHRFFSHQPDLNHNNPQVVKAMIRTMRFWLDYGVDGLRLDAIPYLCVREGTNNENLHETHQVIKEMRAVVDAHYEQRVFLAEANQWPEDVREYFGRGDECHMAYHFPLMPRMYMAVAQEDRHPIVEIMEQTPEIPETCQWAIFLRNHDELTLEMVTDRERDYMYERYATDRRMRLNVGIRRRLAPLMDNDPDRIKLMNSLLMSMPGSPIVYYGDEIGMGDNFFLGDRNGVRTPMQWSPDRNAGFSKADPQRLYLPPIMDPIYGYQAVNVEAQSRDPSSLLNWMKRLIAVRKTYRAFGRGQLTFLRPGNRKILAYIRSYEDEIILCVANLSRSAQPVELDLSEYRTRVPVEMMGHTTFPPIGELPYLLTLPGYGVYWFRLAEEADVPSWHEELLPPAELPVLVLPYGWDSIFPATDAAAQQQAAEEVRAALTRKILPDFLPSQRWFAAKGERLERVAIDRAFLWRQDAGEWLLASLETRSAGRAAEIYFLPLTLVWSEDEEVIRPLLPFTAAKARRRAQLGVLCDAFADERFCRTVVETIGRGEQVDTGDGELRFTPTAAYRELAGEDIASIAVRRPGAEGSNTAVILGDRLFLKGYRRMRPGHNPELEVGRYLTEDARFANIIPVAGSLEYRRGDGVLFTLAILQGYVPNQGDAWSYTRTYLQRFFEDCLAEHPDLEQEGEAIHYDYMRLIHTLGQRTGELHRALARPTANPAFAPEPIQRADVAAWAERIARELDAALDHLERAQDIPEDLSEQIQELRARGPSLRDRLQELARQPVWALKTRHHGDYHLGQVLVTENDFVLIDFEGEPARSLEERRAKHSPLRDVAGMLRSFEYAAYAALLEVTEERPDDLPTLEPYALDWETRAQAAFTEGYRDSVAGTEAAPADAADHARLLELFTLEKVIYELQYELDNRPRWLGIPLRGLARLLAADADREPAPR